MRVKLGISGLPIPVLIQACAEIVKTMAGNPNFPNPDPKLTDVEAAISKLSNAYQAAFNGGKILKLDMYLSEKELRHIMIQLAAYVQTASNGDEAIILTSGMGVVSKKGTPEPIPTPQDLHCLHTDKTGEAPLRCKRAKGAVMYFFQFTKTPDDETSWKDLGTNTKTRFTAEGLNPGEAYWFRVSAQGPAGKSGWSDPAKRMTA